MMKPYINELDGLLKNTLDNVDELSYKVEEEFFSRYEITPHAKRVFYNNINTLIRDIELEFNIAEDDYDRHIRLYHYVRWAFISVSDLYLQNLYRTKVDSAYQSPMIHDGKIETNVIPLSVDDVDWWIEHIVYKVMPE